MTEKREEIEGCEGRFYRKIFRCEACDEIIYTETWDAQKGHMISFWTLLKGNPKQNFCPHCGEKFS